MFVTDALRKQLAVYLGALEERIVCLRQLSERTDEWGGDLLMRNAAERSLHVGVECVTDAANALIDALVMREPGSYSDIVRVIAEEGVVTRDWADAFERAIAVRNRLLRAYYDIKPEDVVADVRACLPLFETFPGAMRAYVR